MIAGRDAVLCVSPPFTPMNWPVTPYAETERRYIMASTTSSIDILLPEDEGICDQLEISAIRFWNLQDDIGEFAVIDKWLIEHCRVI